jgi:hypothetical protein
MLQTKEKPEKIYRSTLAAYLNVATDNVEGWVKKILPNAINTINGLKGENSPDTKRLILGAALNNLFFMDYLYDRPDYFAHPETPENDEENYKKLIEWIDLLFDLRNYWTHIKHERIVLDAKTNECLLELYMRACSESKTNIPERYSNSNGINFSKKDKESETYTITNELSITGIIFFTCLFLDGGQINAFLEGMEQCIYTFDELNKRLKFRMEHPDEPYPDDLTKEKKHFLYARDVYRYWQVRGHRSNIIQDSTLDEKEACFSMLEYLKRCPKEWIDLSQATVNEDHTVTINAYDYDVREKDKFMEWGLAFWDEEMERLGINTWKWARNQTADKKREVKKKLEEKAQESGRPYHFPRYQKVVFDIPEDENERRNDLNDEYGFTYFLLKDETDKATRAMFRYTREDGKMVIGLMSNHILCSVLELYLYKFPIDQENKNKEAFWYKFFHACFKHIETTKRPEEPKDNIRPEQIENRICFLRNSYAEATEKPTAHGKIRFITDTWNQIISCGRTTNLEHANDEKEKLGAKNGHQMLLKYLSLMDNNTEERRKQAHGALLRILQQLGLTKSKESYFDVINKTFQQSRVTNSPFVLRKEETIDAYLDLCIRYREKILSQYEEKLGQEFALDDWRPAYEMRWLGLRDGRTRQASQQTRPETTQTLDTNIVNVDNKQYSAVGLPRDIRHLTEPGWQKYIGEVERLHEKIYPSPKGCMLLIPDFYSNPDAAGLSGEEKRHHVRKRLHIIRRQDTVLSHIAYQKWMNAFGEVPERITLQQANYQVLPFDLPIQNKGGEKLLSIRFYYRYFKQNRYQLPGKLTQRIGELLVNRGIVQGGKIDFNRLRPESKTKLSHNEQCQRLLSREEQGLSFDEKSVLLKERFERMDETIFYPSGDKDRYYFNELLQSYLLCRKVMIEHIQQLERNYLNVHPLEPKEGGKYIPFKEITKDMKDRGYITEQNKLNNIRNAAFHGEIPDEIYIPEALVQKNKDKEQKEYFDYFGEGLALTKEILEKLPKEPKNNTGKINGKKNKKNY